MGLLFFYEELLPTTMLNFLVTQHNYCQDKYFQIAMQKKYKNKNSNNTLDCKQSILYPFNKICTHFSRDVGFCNSEFLNLI
jgi:hypothetical protein